MTEVEENILLRNILLEAAMADYAAELADHRPEPMSAHLQWQMNAMLNDPNGWAKRQHRSVWSKIARAAAMILLAFSLSLGALMALLMPTLHVTVTDSTVKIAFKEQEPAETVMVGTVRTNGGNLNVRAGASISSAIISQLKNGTEVKVLGEKDGWYEIEIPSEYAWVCGKYLQISRITPEETEEGYTFDIDGITYYPDVHTTLTAPVENSDDGSTGAAEELSEEQQAGAEAAEEEW